MALAVGIDWAVITGQGIDFWNHYCVSAAYWFLVPAYAAMWAGGAWLRRRYAGARWDALGRLAFAFVLSVLACHLLAQGSFYWLSDSVTDPTLAGWWKNYTDWLAPYLVTAGTYVAIAAGLQGLGLDVALDLRAGLQVQTLGPFSRDETVGIGAAAISRL